MSALRGSVRSAFGTGLALGLAGLASCAPWPDAAGPEPIVTDRPSFSTAPLLIPAGRVQLETGATWTRVDAETETAVLPEALLRVGVNERFELRALASGWRFIDDASGSRDGLEDLGLAMKARLLPRNGLVPDLGVETFVTFDTGDEGFGSGNTDGGIKLLLGQALDDATYLVANLNLATRTSGQERWTQRAASLYASRALSARCSVFAEWYVVDPIAAGSTSRSAQSFSFGAQFLPSPGFALDARLGAGLDRAADDTFFGLGAAFVF